MFEGGGGQDGHSPPPWGSRIRRLALKRQQVTRDGKIERKKEGIEE